MEKTAVTNDAANPVTNFEHDFPRYRSCIWNQTIVRTKELTIQSVFFDVAGRLDWFFCTCGFGNKKHNEIEV
jgi:hypothetical protein